MDAYEHPPIEVFRGVAASWWSQEADGIQTFNFYNWTGEGAALLGLEEPGLFWKVHSQTYREIGSPEALKHNNKTLVVQRGGADGPTVVPSPTDWTTPR